MKIRIPEGKICSKCPFAQYYAFTATRYCSLFNKNRSEGKFKECFDEFGNGGEFKLVKIIKFKDWLKNATLEALAEKLTENFRMSDIGGGNKDSRREAKLIANRMAEIRKNMWEEIHKKKAEK